MADISLESEMIFVIEIESLIDKLVKVESYIEVD
jgi:hypothetical protein